MSRETWEAGTWGGSTQEGEGERAEKLEPLTAPWSPCSLFPRMPRHNYHKVAPLVQSLCAKHGIEYQSKPLLSAFADIVQ